MGYQTPGTGAKNKQKDQPVQSTVQHAANTRKHLPANPHIAGLSGTAPGHMHLDQSNGEPHGSGDFRRDFPVGSYEAVSLAATIDDAEPLSVDQICEENIQLFRRCDEHMVKQTQLKQKVAGLEKQLEESKAKYAQLAAYVESRKRQNISHV